jgi:tetratricopeptide (TPR) repeat protein
MSKPATAAQLLEQGLFHHRQGDLATAMQRYTEVLHDDPNNADALYYIAVIACQEGQYKEGADLARRAIELGPPQARVHNLLGQALDRLRQPLEAIKNFDKAIALDPNFAAAHGNRANILVDAGMPQEALKSFDRAIALNPKSMPDLMNRGAVLEDLGRPADALVNYDQAIACDPNFAAVHSNRGNVLKELGLIELARGTPSSPRFDEAAAAYDKAIKLDQRLHEALLGRALLNLIRGNWAAGFADYDHRLEVGPPSFKSLPEPRWDGTQREGGRLVLVAEQGLGDTIQCCRFAPVLAERGMDVTILVRKAMAPLLSTLKGVAIATDASELARDQRPLRWLPLLSVPGVLGATPENLPHEVPYLSAAPDRIESWRARLGSGAFRIGINWASGHSDKAHFKRRDIALTNFAAVAALPDVELVSLQKGAAALDVGKVAFRDKIKTIDTDPHADADFFLDTAAVMSQLDLVISCDTSIAHLAGALARPVFTALPVISDWRWLLSRDDTPWYPTMRLFRQDASRNWEPVFTRIVEAVREKMARAGSDS